MIKKLYKSMLPSLILSSMAMTICNQIDVILMGQILGVNAVSAYGLFSPVMMLFSAITGMLSIGITSVCSHFIAKNDEKSIAANFSTIIAAIVVVSIVTVFVLELFPNQIVTLFGAKKGSEVFDLTVDYMKAITPGLPFLLVTSCMPSYLQILGKRRHCIVSVALIGTIDVVLDIVLGSPNAMGIKGMGIATVISQVVGAVYATIPLLKKAMPTKLNLKEIKFSQIVATSKNGSSHALNQLFFSLKLFVFNRILLGLGGENAVAAYSAALSITNLLFGLSVGMGSATQILCGIFHTERDRKGIFDSIGTGLRISLITETIAISALFVFAPRIIPILIKDNANAFALAVRGLRITMFAQIPNGLFYLLKGYYQGTDHIKFVNTIPFVENIIISFIIVFPMTALFGLDGFWITVVLIESITLVYIIVYGMIKTKSRRPSLESIAMLPDDFDTEESQILNVSIREMDNVSDASSKVMDFCIGKGESKRLSYYAALCVEELAVEIINHGFNDRKKHLIDIRIVKTPDSWVLRIRDDCRPFDMSKYMEMHKNDDSVSYLGVRTITKLAKDSRYISALGLNNLTILI